MLDPLEEGQNDLRHWLHVPRDWRRAAVDESYELYWREADQYGQLLPRPQAGEIPAFYATEYYTHCSDGSATENRAKPLHWKLLEHLSWRFDTGIEPTLDWWAEELGSDRLRCLDIGAANGRLMEILTELGHDADGVEPDPESRKLAERVGLNIYPGHGEELPSEVANQKYDLVVFMHVLEHCLDPANAIENAANLLGKGGKLIVEVPNNLCLGAAHFGASWHWLDVPRHLNFFSEKSLTKLLKAHGFDVVKAEYRGYCRQFSAPWVAIQSGISEALELPGHGYSSYATYFARTAFAPPSQKFDSIRIVARMP